MASIIVAHGIILAGLGLSLRSVAPELAKIPLLIALGGGGLCGLWGFAALFGYQRRTGALLSLIAIALTILSPMLRAWMDATGKVAGPMLLTLMLILTVGMILYVMHGERPPEFYQMGPPGRDGSEARENNPPPQGSRLQSKPTR